MLEVIVPGFETTVQDYPGRVGYANLGYPPSGPFNSWSFRLANLLVGNAADMAGLECQLNGPTLAFGQRATIAVTGADMKPTVDENSGPHVAKLRRGSGAAIETAVPFGRSASLYRDRRRN